MNCNNGFQNGSDELGAVSRISCHGSVLYLFPVTVEFQCWGSVA